MSGFLDADDRQVSKHGYRQLAEHLALFQEACDDLGVRQEISESLVPMFFGFLLESMQTSSALKSAEALSDILKNMLNPEGDGDDA